MHTATLRLLLPTILIFGTSLHAATPTISTRSPFVPTIVAPDAPAEQLGPTNIEWCGIMEIKGERYFGLTETEKSRSAWLRVNDESRGFSVKNFTEVGPTLTVTFNSQTHTLRMKQVKVGVLAPGSFPTAPRPLASPANPNPQAGVDEDQERRLSAVAAEVRRRREMRAAAAGQQPSATPQPEATGR